MSARTSNKKRLCFRTAYNRYCVHARDLATWMLGDPLEGDQIASRALMGFALVKGQPADEREVREWIAMEVLSLCLEHNELYACAAAEEDPAASDDDEPEDRDDEDADEGEEIDLASDDLDDTAA
jgi:DNA-directed RNA polymerase specialized sigma24 family protein